VDLFTNNVNGETFEEHRRKMVWTRAEYEWAAQEKYNRKGVRRWCTFSEEHQVTSPCLLKTTSLYHVEPHFNKTEKEKGKGPKALDSNVNQCEALVREAEDNKQLLVNSIL